MLFPPPLFSNSTNQPFWNTTLENTGSNSTNRFDSSAPALTMSRYDYDISELELYGQLAIDLKVQNHPLMKQLFSYLVSLAGQPFFCQECALLGQLLTFLQHQLHFRNEFADWYLAQPSFHHHQQQQNHCVEPCDLEKDKEKEKEREKEKENDYRKEFVFGPSTVKKTKSSVLPFQRITVPIINPVPLANAPLANRAKKEKSTSSVTSKKRPSSRQQSTEPKSVNIITYKKAKRIDEFLVESAGNPSMKTAQSQPSHGSSPHSSAGEKITKQTNSENSIESHNDLPGLLFQKVPHSRSKLSLSLSFDSLIP